ncbi:MULTISPECIES: alpha/beta hydrolase [unclassified Coleofasciculus]|uniref:alpha/beta hydrolase n=1 Tax=Cyanophyceae TaxID=3028117 RepID=UPI001F554D13|nr:MULTISPECIES: alpha/beta hydrolase [unclassified Coleofasciculus]
MMKLKLDWFRDKGFRKSLSRTQTPPFSETARQIGRTRLLAQSLLWGVTLTSLSNAIALLLIEAPVLAAERVTLRLGPFQQSVAIEDLEDFAKTGEVPASLKPYKALLSSEFRDILNRRLHLDPNLGDKVVKDVLRSPVGEELIKKLGLALPNSTVEQLQAGLTLALRQANGLSVISFLQSYPADTITIDASSAIAIALEFNAPYWQSGALGPLLERELTVTKGKFRPAFNPAQAGSETVQQQTLTFHDWRRQEPILGTYTSDRKIVVDLYWANTNEKPPYQNSQNPLVVLSHGFGADRSFLAYVARHLASHGITVAAIEHPGSNANQIFGGHFGSNSVGVPGLVPLLPASEFVAMPKDISFLLDELARLNQLPGSLQGKLNTEKVSVIGHSLGGYTALALAGGELNLDELRQFCKNRNPLGKSGGDWLQCAAADLPDQRLSLRDRRVAQAIALNPVVGDLFGKKGLGKVSTPTLILTGTSDPLTPSLNHQLRPFTQLPSPKYLLTAIGGTHLSISDFAPGSQGEQLTQTTLVNERTGEVAAPLRQLLKGVTLAFVKQLTPAASTYEPFLTPAYAQSLSTPELALRLNTQLPPSVTSWLALPPLP